MTEDNKKMAIVASRGLDDERATISFTIANAGLASGVDVTMFLVSSGVDLVRVGAADHVRQNPLDPPLKELIDNFLASGGKIWCCPPCSKVRGYDQEGLIDGVTLAGSVAMLDVVQQGAATVTF